MKYKITNKTKDERKFWNPLQGKYVYLKSGETIVVDKMIQELIVNPYFKIEENEKKIIIKTERRIKENGRRCVDGNMSNIDK